MCLAATAVAQTDALQSQPAAGGQMATLPTVDLSGDRIATLERWTKEYNEWKAWFAEWRNRREPGFLSTRKRRQPPAPPAWLPDACALLGDEKGAIGDGCRAWRDWSQNDYATEVVAGHIAQTRADLESTRKSIWWEHIHVDALWPMTQVGSNAYGVAGVHTTLQLSRRFQIFLAPGAMMMRLPTADGKERWSPATHWGFSYRLLDFPFPGTHRPSRLHLNIARVWLLGGNRMPTAGEMYLAGFSLTFKDRGDEPGPDHTGDPASSGAHGSLRSGSPQ
jgi:hypothetical protein